MHFEIFVEDRSGKKALEALIPRIIGKSDTYRIIGYRGIGKIPSKLSSKEDPNKTTLLSHLPQMLRGYGKTYNSNPDYEIAFFVVCDLDDKCLKSFRQKLLDVLDGCNPRPRNVRFCFAVEEGEAWFLGDLPAIKKAYPDAREAVLKSYKNDSICGTWEKLADALCEGGSNKLGQGGIARVGEEKSKWAKAISPHMDIDNNNSPSFNYFVRKLRELL